MGLLVAYKRAVIWARDAECGVLAKIPWEPGGGDIIRDVPNCIGQWSTWRTRIIKTTANCRGIVRVRIVFAQARVAAAPARVHPPLQ